MSKATLNRVPFRVLFLCTGNSCRSQMAEGWTRHLLGDRVEAFSAGTEPTGVNPYAIQVMKEAGINISSHQSKSLNVFAAHPFDLIVTLCDDARTRCPVFSGEGKRIHMGFPDPVAAVGSDQEVLPVYREVRDRIREKLIPIIEEEILKKTGLSG